MTGVAATVEFRYGTIRTTFEVVPDRLSAPPAKIALVACPLAGELVLSFARTVVGPTRRGVVGPTRRGVVGPTRRGVVGPTRRGVVGPTRRGVVGPTRRGQPGDLVSAAADADGPSVTRSEPDDGTPVARRH
ncbi:hypothetical protein [Frankia sp. QA3]|uniref:hypothetical protein n=1 Tax=Frankia sp. QA3 TaxID=710111 RepID=UPI0012FA0FA2|nr:hypothetical protein [Frankia sp. QA3]